MNNLVKFVMGSVLSICAATMGSVAMADERDGTIERFTCLDLGVPDHHLKATYVKLNEKDQGKQRGFGGGDMALKLSNDGLNSGTFYTGAGSAATFVFQKKSPGPRFAIYFKPVNVKFLDSVRVFVCMRLATGKKDYLYSQMGAYKPTKIAGGNGWYVASEDLDSFGGEHFRGATIDRITVLLNARGDDGHILVGNTQVFGKKDLLDPSTLIMDEVPCTSDLTCGVFVQK